jgi:DNA polymerase III subunit epsilon
MTDFRGYAVIDTETTGILPSWHHRIAEIAVIQLDHHGTVTGEWSSLVNPDRDLGPQAIHGIRAADARRAPRFEDLAGDLVARLRGRIPVAHNWPFDARHLRAEFDRLDITTPLRDDAGLCTMRAAGQARLGTRSLVGCCAAAGLPNRAWHTAHDDALAAADLFRHFLARAPATLAVLGNHLRAATWPWPQLPTGTQPVRRAAADHGEPHFLARLVERVPRDGEPQVDAYLAMLDRALLDRQISATEGDDLLELAYELGLRKTEVFALHHSYLRDLARAAWADGVVTGPERHDLSTVAALLGLDDGLVDQVVTEERAATRTAIRFSGIGGLVLRPGDKVVLTGEMERDREEITEQAERAGIRVTTGVSRQTRFLVAADPDSLSGKAKKARELGVPVIAERVFLRALDGTGT